MIWSIHDKSWMWIPVMRVICCESINTSLDFLAPDRVGRARLLKTTFQKHSPHQTLGKDSQGVFIFERKPQVLQGYMGFQ